MMLQKTLFPIIYAAIICFVILTSGCLGPAQQHPAPREVAVQCAESLVPGSTITVNETQNGSIICGVPNSTFTLELSDASRSGNQWIINASSGLSMTDEDVTFYHYDQNGTPLTGEQLKMFTGPGMELGLDRWNVLVTNTGIQTINATLQHYISSEPSTERLLNWTVMVK